MHPRDSQLPKQRAARGHSREGMLPPSARREPVDVYFQQPCAACGRRLLIRVEHLGRRIACSHCRRAFIARDVSQDRSKGARVGPSMLDRANELLAMLESWNESRRTYTA